MKNYSLRTRLIAWISVPIIVATLLALLSSYHFARQEIEEVYDAQLVHAAKVLLQLTEHEILKDRGVDLGLENPAWQHRYERNLGFRIWGREGVVTRSRNTEAFGDFQAPPGFSNATLNGEAWRFFVLFQPENGIKIEVSERYDIRYELVVQLMASLIVPALLFLPVILLMTWGGVRRVLKPVVRLSTDVDQRSSGDLSPIRKDHIPREIAPLILALNRLFGRLEDSFKREREFTDHAAHELRTPLAAMKTQTQVLMKQAKSVPAAREGLENLHASINRATRLVEQLLALARLQHETLPQAPVDLAALLHEAVDALKSRADEKQITMQTETPPSCLIKGDGESLAILLGNVLDNAVKYTPTGGAIVASLTPDGVLSVADTGPGLRPAEKEKVFGRFVRVDKTGQSGSGLGLSIVQWIAAAHGVAVTLADNDPHGLIVRMRWPRAR